MIKRNDAFELLRKYNSDPFHIQHALTVEGVMRWFAENLGYSDEVEFWGIVGLLHDIDFEKYPDEHCVKAVTILKEANVDDKIIHGVCCHCYEILNDIKPEHEMEKILYATDELTGLIWATALMHESKSVKDLEVKSVKKKFKSKGFAAGCDRTVIERGMSMLGWDLDTLCQKTIEAMKSCEDFIKSEMKKC